MSTEHDAAHTGLPPDDQPPTAVSAEGDGGGPAEKNRTPQEQPDDGTQPQGLAEQGGGTQEDRETVEELRDRWQRALADLDNLRKRHARELERERSAERARTAAALLPVIDHLELALQHAEADPSSVIEGVKSVRDQAVNVFEQLGFARHDETGVPFDPALHEAVSVVEDADREPGVVTRVLRPGYGDDGQQLRPAAVTVTASRRE